MRLFISIRSHRTNAHNPNDSFPELTVFPFYKYTVLNNMYITILHQNILPWHHKIEVHLIQGMSQQNLIRRNNIFM